MSGSISYGISKSSKMIPYKKKIHSRAIRLSDRSKFLRLIQFLSQHLKTESSRKRVLIVVDVKLEVTQLAAMFFPKVQFYNYGFDFDEEVRDTSIKNIEEVVEVFDKSIAKEVTKKFSDKDLFLFSVMNEQEEDPGDNMKLHLKWLKIMKPVQASIFVKLPYIDTVDFKSIKWLKGYHYWPCWGGKNSSVTFFEPIKEDGDYIEAEWNLKEYEQLCHYQNAIIRASSVYEERVPIPEGNYGLTNDFDSTLELDILSQYTDVIGDVILLISLRISRVLGKKNNPYKVRRLDAM